MHHTVIRKLKDENFLSDFFGKKFLHLRNIIDPAEILNNRSFKNLLHDKELAPSAAIIRTFTSTEFYNGMLRELSEPTFEMEMSRSGTIDDLVELRNKNYGILSLRYESQQLKNLIFELEHYISAFAFSYKNSILELPYSIKTLGISAPIDCFIILLEGRQKFTLDRSVGKLNSTYIELSDGRIFETSVRSSLKDRYFKKENIIGELVEIEVSPGDMLYIPAYTYHFSESLNGSSSLSCSISAEFQSFINIIEDVIRYTDPLKMSELSQCFTLANSSMQN
ncbi:MAG: hypothetical protein KBD78_00990 [Oligoflexales bacterium]|nr:hypothetical protein [Oligoflexales bacterium]